MRDVGEREKNRIHVISFLSITTHWIDCLLNTHTTRDGDRVISCQTRKIKVKPGRCDCMMFAFKTVPSLLFFYLIASTRKWEVDIGHTSTVQMAHKDNGLLRDSEVLEKEHNFCPWVQHKLKLHKTLNWHLYLYLLIAKHLPTCTMFSYYKLIINWIFLSCDFMVKLQIVW